MAGWIKVPLGMEVGLGPGDFVLDGIQLHSPKRWQSPPIFGSCLLWPNGWMHPDATWYVGRDFVLDGDPAPVQIGRRAPSPIFGPCLLWPNGRPSELLLALV